MKKKNNISTSVFFSEETMRQVTELQEAFGESRSRVVSRAIDFLYIQYEDDETITEENKKCSL